jgi:hypothetical protein
MIAQLPALNEIATAAPLAKYDTIMHPGVLFPVHPSPVPVDESVTLAQQLQQVGHTVGGKERPYPRRAGSADRALLATLPEPA